MKSSCVMWSRNKVLSPNKQFVLSSYRHGKLLLSCRRARGGGAMADHLLCGGRLKVCGASASHCAPVICREHCSFTALSTALAMYPVPLSHQHRLASSTLCCCHLSLTLLLVTLRVSMNYNCVLLFTYAVSLLFKHVN